MRGECEAPIALFQTEVRCHFAGNIMGSDYRDLGNNSRLLGSQPPCNSLFWRSIMQVQILSPGGLPTLSATARTRRRMKLVRATPGRNSTSAVTRNSPAIQRASGQIRRRCRARGISKRRVCSSRRSPVERPVYRAINRRQSRTIYASAFTWVMSPWPPTGICMATV